MPRGSRDLSIVEIKDLTLEQLRQIFEIRSDDISVFIGVTSGRRLPRRVPRPGQLAGEVESAVLNGPIVQVNLKSASLDDVMEDPSFQFAFGQDEEKST